MIIAFSELIDVVDTFLTSFISYITSLVTNVTVSWLLIRAKAVLIM